MRDDLPEPDLTNAKRLFDLVGPGRRPAHDPRAKDLRGRDRSEAWRGAEFARQRVEEGADVGWVMQLAKAVGFFSVWMSVFADDIQMCARPRRSFPGTR